MAKVKKDKNNNSGQTVVSTAPATPAKPIPHLLIVAVIGIITWLFLKTCLSNHIGTWDDVPYLRDNPVIKDLSWEGIMNIFRTPVMGNYHPLTILSYAIEYSIVNLEPWLYHFDSLVLHLLATILVYWMAFLLFRSWSAAAVTSLLFGLHPMHMESVAWVAARKDVLYGVFYLASCICYIYYLRAEGVRRKIQYIAVLFLFICALLSKPVAVTLPLILLLIDYLEKRKMNRSAIIEKIPHLLLALVFGIIAIKVQQNAGAMALQKIHFNIAERLALGCYALITYLWKAVLPLRLHCLYPYPDKIDGALPYVYYAYPLAVAGILLVIWKFARAKRIIIFGSFFFLVNIFLILQFLQVGDAIVAERYTYIPYLGLFFIAGYYFSILFENNKKTTIRYTAVIAAAIAILYLGTLANDRCKVWDDDTSLWRDEIENEPARAIHAYNNLGYLYYGKWASTDNNQDKKLYYDSAYYLINKAITLKPDFPNAYLALGELERSAGQYEEAKKNYYNAISALPNESNFYVGLAILYVVTKNNDSAGYYFRKVLEVAPTAEAYGNYANFLAIGGNDDSAIVQYGKAIALSKTNHVFFMNRGIVMKKHDRWKEALNDFEAAIRINPDIGEVYYHRSFCDTQLKNTDMALKDIEKAISLGFKGVDTAYLNRVKQMNSRQLY